MVSSACEILASEPKRFINYLFSDPKLRKSIVDQKTFVKALRTVLQSDPSLKEIIKEIDLKKEKLEVCGKDIFDSGEIQGIIRENIGRKKRGLQRKVLKKYPTWTRTQRKKEVERRLKISVAVTKVPEPKQVTIQEALRPVKVDNYTRKGKRVSGYKRTKARDLTDIERRLIRSNIGKPVKEVMKIYYGTGQEYRSPESIKKHYFRIKKKLRP